VLGGKGSIELPNECRERNLDTALPLDRVGHSLADSAINGCEKHPGAVRICLVRGAKRFVVVKVADTLPRALRGKVKSSAG
jgi:hypothetical protein